MEEIILSDRRKGKTTKLIEMCHKDKYSLIVCPTNEMCKYVFKMAKDMNKEIPMPITFSDFVNHRWYSHGISNFYFDELQMSLQNIAGNVPIKSAVIDTSHLIVRTLF